MHPWIDGATLLAGAFIVGQLLYSAAVLADLRHGARPVNWVRMADVREVPERDYPEIVLFYPLLHEPEAAMRTTLLAVSRVRYPAEKVRVIAVPNHDDHAALSSLQRLQNEFDFLEVLTAPPPRDPSWELILDAWQGNENCYWWHDGRRAYDRDLPPGKTRQLIYALYHTAAAWRKSGDFLVNFIDADSPPSPDHFMAAVAGMRHYDVLQSRTIAAAPNASLAAGLDAFDHMASDAATYPRCSGDGRHPFGLPARGPFFRACDLIELGGLHPWIPLEAPELGLRFWKHGRRLGVIREPRIEPAPRTFSGAIAQRQRWVCGVFQSLSEPLERLSFSFLERCRAWLNVLPRLSLWLSVIAMPTAAWAVWPHAFHQSPLPPWATALAGLNLAAFALSVLARYLSAWKQTRRVLENFWARVAYMLRVNPVFVVVGRALWLAPLTSGLWLYLRRRGDGQARKARSKGRSKAEPARVEVPFRRAALAQQHRRAA